jgi:hypothetical protein
MTNPVIDLIQYLEGLRDSGVEHIEGADTFEPAWPANLAVIIGKAKACLEPQGLTFPEGCTDDDRDRIVLRAVLERGKFPYPGKTEIGGRLSDLHLRGFLVGYDRLGSAFEMTPEGHRHLAAIDPSYQAPAGLFVNDRWNDPEALVCHLAYLLGGGKHAIKRPTKEDADDSFDGRTVSPEAAALLREEAQRLAGK